MEYEAGCAWQPTAGCALPMPPPLPPVAALPERLVLSAPNTVASNNTS